MMSFSGNKADAAQYVNDYLLASKPGSLSITITDQDTSGGCCVYIATDMSSDDIVKMLGQACLERLTST
jgi:hypothetical protein